jgi:hypothetical protein
MPPGSPSKPPAARPTPWGKVIVVIIVLGALTMAAIVVYLRLGTMRAKREAGEARLVIEAKIKDGRATVEDLRQLQALCVRLGDAACIDRAAGLVQQRTQPEPPKQP